MVEIKGALSSLLSVHLGQGIFKPDYITRYLHSWVVLRLCIVFTIGESPNIVIGITIYWFEAGQK